MSDLDTLLAALSSANAIDRVEARRELVALGPAAVPQLCQLLTAQEQHLRWEAAKALAKIGHPSAAPDLVRALGDDDIEVRWVAAEALIAIGHDALEPVLRGIIETKNCAVLLQGSHHVLNDLAHDRSDPLLGELLNAYRQPEPEIAVPIAAQAALTALSK